MLDAQNFPQLAEQGAALIYSGFKVYQTEFKTITRRAQSRFEQRDWHGVQRDSIERLDLYKKIVDGLVAETRTLLGEATKTETVWAQMKAAYSRLIAGGGDFELEFIAHIESPGNQAFRPVRSGAMICLSASNWSQVRIWLRLAA